MKSWIIFFLSLALLNACTKGTGTNGVDDPPDPHEYNPQDLTAPVLVIHTPTSNEIFTSGATIRITGRISDDLGLYRGSIRVMQDAGNVEVKKRVYEIHGVMAYDFSLDYVTGVTAATDYTVIVSFEDHGYNTATKSVKVRVNP